MLLECGGDFPELLMYIFRLEPKLSELWPATEAYDIFVTDAVFCCIFAVFFLLSSWCSVCRGCSAPAFVCGLAQTLGFKEAVY